MFHQEPGSNDQIKKFVREVKGCGFDLFAKIDVNGETAIPLYKYLQVTLTGSVSSSIKRNFTKFLVDKHGVPFKRYSGSVEPVNIEPDIKNLLDQYVTHFHIHVI